MARLTYRITVLVTAQIFLIVTSFLIMIHFESQLNLAGNVVNVAGENRVLTILVRDELRDKLFQEGDQALDESRTLAALDALESNILFLKEGGTSSGIEISPLSPRFEGDWNLIWDMFGQYRAEVLECLSTDNTDATAVITDIDTVKYTGDRLVALSDELTDKLSHDVDVLLSNLIHLQVFLGITNVVAHIFLIFLIWRIFSRHTAEMVRMGKITAVGELAVAMAHDMKTPLGVIQNSTSLIRHRGGDSDVVGSTIDRMERAAKKMSHQIDGIMNSVRNVPLVMSPTSVLEMLGRSVTYVDVPDTIRISMPKDDALVTCDPAKMEMVFANLLLNAIQAIGDDYGYVTIRLVDGGTVTIEFENSGPPIPESYMPSLFEPLFTTKLQGTGLGLVSCRNIMEQHGGSISVSNDPVVFTLRLPKSGQAERGGD